MVVAAVALAWVERALPVSRECGADNYLRPHPARRAPWRGALSARAAVAQGAMAVAKHAASKAKMLAKNAISAKDLFPTLADERRAVRRGARPHSSF